MKPTTYAQCRFRQAVPGANSELETSGERIDVAWIPGKFARRGKVIRIDGRDGVWTIIEVYTTRLTEEVLARERDHRHQRAASDIERGKRSSE